MMKTLTFSVLSALLAFNVGTHLETSKVAKFKLKHYQTCVDAVMIYKEGKKGPKTDRMITGRCSKLLR